MAIYSFENMDEVRGFQKFLNIKDDFSPERVSEVIRENNGLQAPFYAMLMKIDFPGNTNNNPEWKLEGLDSNFANAVGAANIVAYHKIMQTDYDAAPKAGIKQNSAFVNSNGKATLAIASGDTDIGEVANISLADEFVEKIGGSVDVKIIQLKTMEQLNAMCSIIEVDPKMKLSDPRIKPDYGKAPSLGM